MTTRETIGEYFRALSERRGWQTFLADGMVFTRRTSPIRKVIGKDAFIESTKGFYSMIESFEVRQLMVDGDRACALTRYSLRPPAGDAFTSDVAELFAVENDRIASFEIYFDSAPYSA